MGQGPCALAHDLGGVVPVAAWHILYLVVAHDELQMFIDDGLLIKEGSEVEFWLVLHLSLLARHLKLGGAGCL